MITLNGKVIVVIGGTTGMGLSASRAFIGAGARVVAVGRNAANVAVTQKLLGKKGRALAGDAVEPDTAVEAIALAEQSFGGFDGLYHVAGGSGRRMGDGPLHQITDQGWNYTITLNLTSMFNSNRAAAQKLLDLRKDGAIVNIGSVLGFSPSPHFFATHAYAAAKAATIGFTKAAASYYAPHQIRFNVIAPALVETPMAQRSVSNPKIMDFIRTKQPLHQGKAGNAADLDILAAFLLSDAGQFVTGQVFTVDGGWSVSEGQIPDAFATDKPKGSKK